MNTVRKILKYGYSCSHQVSNKVAWLFSDWFWAGSVSMHRDFKLVGEKLECLSSGTSINVSSLAHFYPRLDWLSWCMKNFAMEEKDGKLFLQKHWKGVDLAFEITGKNDVLVVVEAFKDAQYQLDTLQKMVLVDFGVNHAIVSLQLGADPAIVAAYGYELVPATYRQALTNLERNPVVAAKYHLTNAGVGLNARRVSVNGFEGGSLIAHAFNEVIDEGSGNSIEILPAGETINEIASKHPNVPIFLKMDIEGAEWEVVESLAQHGSFNHLAAIALEFHHGHDTRIMPVLLDFGFVCRHFRFEANQQMGIINGFRLTK